MNYLIIEDEKIAALRLEEMLQELEPDCTILAKIGSIKESIKWLMLNKADIIFLDIQLSDGLSFSIFDKISVSTPVIFTTAYDQYAIKAFELNSISYLLKPIKKQDLKKSLEKFGKIKSGFAIDLESLISTYQNEKLEYKKRFLITIGNTLKKLEVEDAAYFYAMDKSVYSKTFDGKTLPIEYSLDALEELLDPKTFFRINRKYLVNMNAIKRMEAWSRSRIKLHLEPVVSGELDSVVSINRSANFKKWIGS
ncbi:MAG: LytTR family DNA-binding domain-containing protein [Balneolaceae bacterium]